MNRNWPVDNWRSDPYHPCCGHQEGMGGSEALSEPETQATYYFIMNIDPAIVIVWHAQGPVTEGNETGISEEAAQLYADSAGYIWIAEWTAYVITGQFIDAMQMEGVPAFDVELSSPVGIDFQNNLSGVLAVIELISDQ